MSRLTQLLDKHDKIQANREIIRCRIRDYIAEWYIVRGYTCYSLHKEIGGSKSYINDALKKERFPSAAMIEYAKQNGA